MRKLKAVAFFIILSLTIFGQNIQTTTYETWSNNSWIKSTSQTNSYDNGGNLLMTITSIWDSLLNKWCNYSQIIYTNNSDGTIQYSTIQSWNNVSGLWLNSSKSTFAYNEKQKVNSIVYENWSIDTWVKNSKKINHYDTNGYLISSKNQIWDNINLKWNDYSQQVITNNPDGVIQNSVSQSWNAISQTWINGGLIDYTYSPQTKKILTTINSIWINGKWENSSSQIYNYDTSDQMNNLQTKMWDNNTKNWKNYTQNIYTNNNSVVQQYISQIWNSSSYSWTNGQRVSYTYPLTTENDEVKDLKIKLFPNPCVDKIHFQVPNNSKTKINIYDIKGNLVYVNTLNDYLVDIDVSNLISGLYIICVCQESHFMQSKFEKLE